MKTICFANILLLFICSYATASQIGFRDMIIGMDRVELIVKSAEKLVECRGDVCEYSSSVKGSPVSVNCYIKDEKLFFIRVEFDPSNYKEIKSAMKEKWGEPKSITKDKLTNLFGVSVASENLLWLPPDGVVMMSQYGDLTKGVVTIGGQDFLSTFNSYRAEKKSGGGF